MPLVTDARKNIAMLFKNASNAVLNTQSLIENTTTSLFICFGANALMYGIYWGN